MVTMSEILFYGVGGEGVLTGATSSLLLYFIISSVRYSSLTPGGNTGYNPGNFASLNQFSRLDSAGNSGYNPGQFTSLRRFSSLTPSYGGGSGRPCSSGGCGSGGSVSGLYCLINIHI